MTIPLCQAPGCGRHATLRSTRPNGNPSYKRFCPRHRASQFPDLPPQPKPLRFNACAQCGWFGYLSYELCPNCYAHAKDRGQANPLIHFEDRLSHPDAVDPYAFKPKAPSLNLQNE